MLLKVILKPIKVMITCKKLAPYLMDLAISLCVLRMLFCNLGSTTNFKKNHFSSTPLRAYLVYLTQTKFDYMCEKTNVDIVDKQQM